MAATASAEDAKLPFTESKDVSELTDIGSGSFGKIFKCKWKGQYCALKVLRSDLTVQGTQDWIRNRMVKEVAQMFDLCKSDSRFVKVMSLYIDDGSLNGFIMELCQLGNMRQFLSRLQHQLPNHPRLPWLTLSLLHDISQAMHILQEKCILHRDLALDNILISDDLHAKISDFGLSKRVNSEITQESIQAMSRMSFERLPPEQLQDSLHKPDIYTDRYLFGICLVEAFTCVSLRHRVNAGVNEFQHRAKTGGIASRLRDMVRDEAFQEKEEASCKMQRKHRAAYQQLRDTVLDTVEMTLSLKPEHRPSFADVSEKWKSSLEHAECIQHERQLAFRVVNTNDDEEFVDDDEEEEEAAGVGEKRPMVSVQIGTVHGPTIVHRGASATVGIKNSSLWRRQFPKRRMRSSDCQRLAASTQLQRHWLQMLQLLGATEAEVGAAERRCLNDGLSQEEALAEAVERQQVTLHAVAEAVRALPLAKPLAVLKIVQEIASEGR